MLIDDYAFNAQGTFYFPAGFRNETQYVAFWDAVAIPDRALEKLLSEQGPFRRDPNLRDPGSEAVRKLESMLERAALSAGQVAIREGEWLRSGHELLTQVLARPVARATGLATYLPAELDGATRDRILDHEFELGDGRWLNARVIVDRFETLGLGFLRP